MLSTTLSSCVRVSVLASLAGPVAGQLTARVSVDSNEVQAGFHSQYPSISRDGRFVAFASLANNLVPGDTNGANDIFVRDRLLGTTERVSVGLLGVEGDEESSSAAISGDGRFVAFTSEASNFVVGDTNDTYDVFVRDRQSGTTTCVSVDSLGTIGDQSSGYPNGPSISADGRYVAFESGATNLVAGDINAMPDVFLHDLQTGVTTLVSVDALGVQGNHVSVNPSLSAGGNYVVFESLATNLVAGDTNGRYDVFVRDLAAGTLERVSLSSGGLQGNRDSKFGVISADGRYVAFASLANTLAPNDPGYVWDVFLRDRQNGTTEKISTKPSGAQANAESLMPAMTDDGRFIAFVSYATNIVPEDGNTFGDVFLRDRQNGVTIRVSTPSNGGDGDSVSYGPSLSAHAAYVAFTSRASNLVAGDTNVSDDVFVHTLFHKVQKR